MFRQYGHELASEIRRVVQHVAVGTAGSGSVYDVFSDSLFSQIRGAVFNFEKVCIF